MPTRRELILLTKPAGHKSSPWNCLYIRRRHQCPLHVFWNIHGLGLLKSWCKIQLHTGIETIFRWHATNKGAVPWHGSQSRVCMISFFGRNLTISNVIFWFTDINWGMYSCHCWKWNCICALIWKSAANSGGDMGWGSSFGQRNSPRVHVTPFQRRNNPKNMYIRLVLFHDSSA